MEIKKIKIPSLTPDAFGKKTNPVCNPKNIYVTYVMAMANKVPFGIASAGSFKSPDKFAPATIPLFKENNLVYTENLN